MNEKTLRILEYDKIIQKLASLTASELGRELAEAVQPERSFSKVQSLLKETNDGVSFIMRRGSPPLGGIHDIRPGIKLVANPEINRDNCLLIQERMPPPLYHHSLTV